MDKSVGEDITKDLQKGLDHYYKVGRRLAQAQEWLQTAATGKTWTGVVAKLPFGRRQAYYILDIYKYKNELEAAGIRTYTAARKHITELRRRERDNEGS